MHVIEQARQAYAPNQIAIRTERSIESELFSQITARLRKASLAEPADFNEIAAAVYENRRLWTTLAAGVADTENKLPQELRSQIFYLAEFTDLHSRKVLNRQANVSALIEINTAVLRGLRGKGAK